jgi:hypothetical protein
VYVLALLQISISSAATTTTAATALLGSADTSCTHVRANMCAQLLASIQLHVTSVADVQRICEHMVTIYIAHHCIACRAGRYWLHNILALQRGLLAAATRTTQQCSTVDVQYMFVNMWVSCSQSLNRQAGLLCAYECLLIGRAQTNMRVQQHSVQNTKDHQLSLSLVLSFRNVTI